MMAGLTANERFLLEWLSKEDASSRGECSGPSLNNLMAFGLVETSAEDARGPDYDAIRCTEAGYALARENREEPTP